MAKPTMYESAQERLKELKQFQLDELRSANPSKLYLADLEVSIKAVENDLNCTVPGRWEFVGKI